MKRNLIGESYANRPIFIFVILVIFLLFFSSISFLVVDSSTIKLNPSNDFGYQWWKTYGEIEIKSNFNFQLAGDGGYIVIGTKSYYKNEDLRIFRTDSSGVLLWDRIYGDKYDDLGICVEETRDGGIIIGGNTKSFGHGGGRFDIWLIKTDRNGFEEWNITIGTKDEETITALHQTNDGGYIILGSYTKRYNDKSNVWLIRTDSSGHELWNRTYGNSMKGIGNDLKITSDNGFVVTGWTGYDENNHYDAWLVRTDSSGNELWNNSYGGTENTFERGFVVFGTPDNGFIVAGYEYPSWDSDVEFPQSIFLIKTDSKGEKQWMKTYGSSEDSEFSDMCITPEGNSILLGRTSFGEGDEKQYRDFLLKIDPNGEIIWNRKISGENSVLLCSIVTETGEIVLLGELNNDPLIAKTNSEGTGPGAEKPIFYFLPDRKGNTYFDESALSGKAFAFNREKLSIELKIDNGDWNKIGETGIRGSWGYKWDTTGVANGEHTLSGRCTDGEVYSDINTMNVRVENYKMPKPRDSEPDWVRLFGLDKPDRGKSIKQTSDGGFILTGMVENYYNYDKNDLDACLIKTDENGKEQWIRYFGETYDEVGNAVIQTSDGGYVIGGYIDKDDRMETEILLIRTDSDGFKLWERTFGGEEYDEVYSITEASDGGFVFTGKTNFYYELMLVKIGLNGDTLWSKTITGTKSDVGHSISGTADGGYIIAGYTENIGAGEEDVYLIKINSVGDTQWSRTFGGRDKDMGYSVTQTLDGGFIIAGSKTVTPAGTYWDNVEAWVIKTDGNGIERWNRTYEGFNVQQGDIIVEASDGGYIIGGEYNDKIAILKIDTVGDPKWLRTPKFTEGGTLTSICPSGDGGYVFTGSAYAGMGNSDIMLVKINSRGGNVESDEIPFYLLASLSLIIIVILILVIVLIRRKLNRHGLQNEQGSDFSGRGSG